MESNQIQNGQDKAEEIPNQGVGWNVYGKITQINRSPGSTKPALAFGYNASGNRVFKTVIHTTGSSDFTTWYVRDAQGNVLATYKAETAKSDGALLKLTLLEHEIYGNSRLGLTERNMEVTTLGTTPEMLRNIGIKRYELTNHLGNVLEVITDKKRPIDDGVYSATGTKTSSVPDGIIDYYLPSILTATAYYPFGMQMPGLGANTASYRFGFNGKEMDDEVAGTGNMYDYGFRIYNPRIGKFLSVDPLTKDYPMLTPYQYASNSPIWFIDVDGLEGSPYLYPGQSQGYQLLDLNHDRNVDEEEKQAARQFGLDILANSPIGYLDDIGNVVFTGGSTPRLNGEKLEPSQMIMAPFMFAASMYLMLEGPSTSVLKNAVSTRVGVGLGKATIDFFNQYNLKGNIKDVDIANSLIAGVSGSLMGKVPKTVEEAAKALVDYEGGEFRIGFIDKNGTEVITEFTLRVTTNVVQGQNKGSNLLEEVGIDLLKKGGRSAATEPTLILTEELWSKIKNVKN